MGKWAYVGEVRKIRKGDTAMQINTYLHFNGNCEEAFNFYAKVLGGKVGNLSTFADAPREMNVPEHWRKKVMHIRLEAEGQVLMASDVMPNLFQQPQGFRVNINMKDPARGKRIFDELSAGGKVMMPFAATFWSPGFGMFDDKFGTPWMINCE